MASNLAGQKSTRRQLHELLNANLQLPAEYQENLTNHLPMALHSLQCLGASPARLREFYEVYASRFQAEQQPNAALEFNLPACGWRQLRGKSDAYRPLLARFNELVAHRGTDVALSLTLPDLMSGVAAAAFHGVIRTAHAVQAGHTGELAAALAYWAWRWQPLCAPSLGEWSIPFDCWTMLLTQRASGWRSDGQRISIRMDEASRSDIYLALAGELAPAASFERRIAELAAFAVDRYVAAPNFTVLHLITSLRALRTLLPWIQDSESMQAVVVHCVVAAYLAARPAPVNATSTVKAKSWPEVVSAAIASNDDHVIKLVQACREEAARYGEGQYLLAATLATNA